MTTPISLIDISKKYVWNNYTYGNAQVFGYMNSSLSGKFISIEASLTVVTNNSSRFYIKIPRNLLPPLSYVPGANPPRVYPPWLSLHFDYNIQGVYNDYSVYYGTDSASRHIIYYDSDYIYAEFVNPQLADGNSFPRLGCPLFYFNVVCYIP
jgi:hypothetical protein